MNGPYEVVEKLTYYVVQTYQMAGRNGISADDPMPARDRDHAQRLFERYTSSRAGVVAFYRTGNPTTGDWDDATIIARHGKLPADVDGLRNEDDADFERWDIGERDLKVA
ncbi:hypothetical protein B6S44_19520 [Bosea sp. Tri-44]|uniref:hypothetical protein n=1 Tax=Bosea sp. Tri-44 TaxID=1972137 RepID=UPI00100E5888|nr:hypothetical protein [Bosea sp. Tri-44]RXT52931.1 hypothetical protein B6S44_19520 [Bosea sp. Tri-44]